MSSSLDLVATLKARIQAELSADFPSEKPTRITRAPGRLDVMGGIAEWTGSMVCQAALKCGAAVALQRREDRQLQVFSFNQFDQNRPFTLRMPLDRLADCSAEQLRTELANPGMRWGGHVVGLLFVLHRRGLIDLHHPVVEGMNIAFLNTVPPKAGLGSSAALQAAVLSGLLDELNLRQRVEAIELASICREVQIRIVGRDSGIAGALAAFSGHSVDLLQIRCQPPYQLAPSLHLPSGFRIIGISTGTKAANAAKRIQDARTSAQIAYAIVLDLMCQMGQAAGREMIDDPMRGYLGNLNQDDYKSLFRPFLPEILRGSDFIDRHGDASMSQIDARPDVEYHIQQAADHHVLEARRVRQFCEFLNEAASLDLQDQRRYTLMDKAGHLMYASHLSYTNDALLGSDECDLLIELVRKHEKEGLYGARITAGGCGGTVAVLCEATERAHSAIEQIVGAIQASTGNRPELLSVAAD